jgi:hypothetical protein
MYLPTAVNIQGKPYFKYYKYSIPQKKIIDKTHTYICCCEENTEKSKRCSYSIRYNHFNANHQPQWVDISFFPYSRIPEFVFSDISIINENDNSKIETLLDSIVMFFTRCAISDCVVEKPEFKQMILNCFNFSNSSFGSDQKFKSIINNFTRENLNNRKLKLAALKKEYLFQKLKGKFSNLIIDSGTYAGTKRLLVKVGRPIEKQTHLQFNLNINLNSTISTQNTSSSSDLINSPILPHKSIKLYGSPSSYTIEPYPKTIEYASPCLPLLSADGEKSIRLISTKNSSCFIYKQQSPTYPDFGKNDDFSPFLLKCYAHINSADQYINSLIDSINLVNCYGGEVGSITGDALPVQQMILNFSKNKNLKQSILAKNEVILDSESETVSSSQYSFSNQFSSQNFLSHSTEIIENNNSSDNIEKNYLIETTEKNNSTTSTPAKFVTPKIKRHYALEDPIPSLTANYTTIFPISYVCNCHRTHSAFIQSLKNNIIGHNFVSHLKRLTLLFQKYEFKSLIGSKIPSYIETRWLSTYNCCTFLIKNSALIQDIFLHEKLPLIHGIFFFRKSLFPIIKLLMYNERDDVNVNNIFSMASQLILYLRIIQNNFEYTCPNLVEWVAELSYQVFEKFFLGEKGIYNCLTFFLTSHGRDSIQKGYMQWGPSADSLKFFNFYEFLS